MLRIISIIIPLLVMAAFGYVVGRRMKPQMTEVNKLNMDVFLPALVFSAILGRDFHVRDFVLLAVAAFIVVVGCGLLGWWVARMAKIDGKTLVPPIMFTNSADLGLPLAVLAFGEHALAPAVVMFTTSNLIHFSFGIWMFERRMHLWRVPSVFALIFGLLINETGIHLWEPLSKAIEMIGQIVIPLMLFALGVRIADMRLDAWRAGILAAVVRPLSGLIVALPLTWMLDLSAEQSAMLILFSALPPAVSNYLFAERYRQEPEKVASMVLVGNLAAIVVIPVVLVFVLP